MSVLLAALTAGALSTAAPAGAAAADAWSAAYGDSGNTTYNGGETAITAATASGVNDSWTATPQSFSPFAPVVVNGAALHLVSGWNTGDPSYLTATSPKDGATLWTVALPTQVAYWSGMASSGSLVLVPFTGSRGPGGVTGVDVSSRSVVWTKTLPPSAISWAENKSAGNAYTDGQRVYISGAGYAVNAYRLSDGALLWSLPYSYNDNGTLKGVDGFAVGAGTLYTGGAEGIVAYEAASGRRLWAGQGASGQPVVAGGRVFGTTSSRVVAFPAGGCGSATCAPLWTTVTDPISSARPTLGGADGTTLFATWSEDRLTSDRSRREPVGRVARLDAATGAIQWSLEMGRYALGLIRAADVIWFYNDYVRADGTVDERIAAFSARATGNQPLRLIPLPSGRNSFPQQLAVAGGTLFQQTNGGPLAGFRVGAPANAAPTATFDFGTTGLGVNVNGGASSDVDGTIRSYVWTFGDGGTSNGATTHHDYAKAGTYTVTLAVTDDDGATTLTSRTVTVSAPPPPPAPPAASGPFVADAFGRTVSGGLGTADTGGAWSTSGGAADIAVSNGSAALTMRKPGSQIATWLGATSRTDTDLRVHLSVDKRPTGSSAYVDVVGRRVSADNEYRGRVGLRPDGRVSVAINALKGSSSVRTLADTTKLPSSITYGPGTGLEVRLQVVGTAPTTVRLKVWPTGTAEPTAWQRTATDTTAALQKAGAVGLTTYLTSNATNAPVVLRIDDLSARPAG